MLVDDQYLPTEQDQVNLLSQQNNAPPNDYFTYIPSSGPSHQYLKIKGATACIMYVYECMHVTLALAP